MGEVAWLREEKDEMAPKKKGEVAWLRGGKMALKEKELELDKNWNWTRVPKVKIVFLCSKAPFQ